MAEEATARLLARLEMLGPPQAWKQTLPPPPWGDPDFSRRVLHAMLAEDQDLAGRRPATAVAQARWIAAALPPGATILDLGCGAGLHALEWAAAGHPVTAVDLSPAPLDYLRQRATSLALPVRTHQQDLRHLTVGGAFDGIVLLYGLFHTLNPGEGAALLADLRSRLRPGGHLFVELRTPDGWDRRAYRTVVPGGDSLFGAPETLVLVDHGWDEAARAEVEQVLIQSPDGQIQAFVVTERAVGAAEWAAALAAAGLMGAGTGAEWPSENPTQWRLHLARSAAESGDERGA